MFGFFKRSLFSNFVVVYIWKNRMEVHDLTTGASLTATSQTPFTSTRLLIGEFQQAADLLKQLLAQIRPSSTFFFAPVFAPAFVVQPMEMTEGGLSGVEQKIFFELAFEAGARASKMYVSDEKLTPEHAQDFIANWNKQP